MTTSPSWDVFIAHSSSDTSEAEKLFFLLAPYCRVFLDSQRLQLGDDWDRALAQAQQRSRITVVLVSSRSDLAYYQREEIAAAIALARKDQSNHRVVPIYLDDQSSDDIPYGLRGKHSLKLSKVGFAGSAEALLRLLSTTNDAKDITDSTSWGRSDAVIRPQRIGEYWAAVSFLRGKFVVVPATDWFTSQTIAVPDVVVKMWYVFMELDREATRTLVEKQVFLQILRRFRFTLEYKSRFAKAVVTCALAHGFILNPFRMESAKNYDVSLELHGSESVRRHIIHSFCDLSPGVTFLSPWRDYILA